MITSSSGESAVLCREAVSDEDSVTYVAGVGPIPREIYMHVKSDPLGDLPRFSIHILIQHYLLASAIFILAATGLPLHYSDVFWAKHLMIILGGVDMARLIHRLAAGLLIVSSLYHLGTVIGGTIQKIIKKEFDYRRTQIPRWKDLVDLVQDIQYFLDLRPYRPKMEKFCYKQKMHYLAMFWGIMVMTLGGTTLLFPETMAQIWPNPAFFQDLARLMHADEAIMAVLVLVFWHWSNVHLVPGRFPVQWTFATGKITREHQIEEHFLEYVRNLDEIPEEREYLRKVLQEWGIIAVSDETQAGSLNEEVSN